MPIEVNDFVIQSKVIQACGDSNSSGSTGESSSTSISESVKKEIIDDCFEKVVTYLERKQNRF